MAHALSYLLLACALAACGASATARTPAPPTAPLPDPAELLANLAGSRAIAPPTPETSPTPRPAARPTPATAFEQYHAWMAEARALYPYDESLDSMWSVMLCESEGNPDLAAGDYHGLFQYSADTWAGEWNPYRESSIYDPHAQIFATAKAWHDGKQGWWGCYQ
jgi:hypothetical protein